MPRLRSQRSLPALPPSPPPYHETFSQQKEYDDASIHLGSPLASQGSVQGEGDASHGSVQGDGDADFGDNYGGANEAQDTDDDFDLPPSTQPLSDAWQAGLDPGEDSQATEKPQGTSSALPKAGKGDCWTVDQHRLFVETLADLARNGEMSPSIANWLSKCLKKAVAALEREYPSINWKSRVKNKYNHMKKKYRDWEGFGKRSGVALDPVTGRYRASQACFEAYFAINPTAKWLRYNGLSLHELYAVIFSSNWASGEHATTAAERLRADNAVDEEPERPPERYPQAPLVIDLSDEESGPPPVRGRPQRLTVAEAQYHVGERLLQAAQTFLRHEPWILACRTLRQYPWTGLTAETKHKMIRAFRNDEGIARWWLQDEECREMIVEHVETGPLDGLSM